MHQGRKEGASETKTAVTDTEKMTEAEAEAGEEKKAQTRTPKEKRTLQQHLNAVQHAELGLAAQTLHSAGQLSRQTLDDMT